MAHIQHEKEPLLARGGALGDKHLQPQKPPSLLFMYLTVFISSVGFTVVLPSLWYYLDNEVSALLE
jgi:hypothetical protein